MDQSNQDVITAIRDLTRVVIALQGGFASRSDAIRGLGEYMPPSRIAAIFDMESKDVRSVLAKARKQKSKQS